MIPSIEIKQWNITTKKYYFDFIKNKKIIAYVDINHLSWGLEIYIPPLDRASSTIQYK